MKRILITGKNSYVGQSFIHWINQSESDFYIDELDMRNELWEKNDFSSYDVVFHVAGIAHVSTNPNMEELYYKVNRDLTIDTAKKAKSDGVSQFIFMSSMIVYGENKLELSNITLDTKPEPTNFYGKSKLQAETEIRKMCDEHFKVVILRPPMIYGNRSKGNYQKLSTLAQKSLLFPDIENKRSMLHIDNLTEFLRLIIENEEFGYFFPQNKEYVKTSTMVKLISECNDKKIRLTKAFNFIIMPFIDRINLLNKVFGDLAYEQSMSEYKEEYIIRNFEQSIKITENKSKSG